MHRLTGGVLLLLLALSPAWAEDKPKDKPPEKADTPAAKLAELQNEQQAITAATQKAMQAAKTDQDRQAAFSDQQKKLAALMPKFLDLADKNPKESFAIDVLGQVAMQIANSGGDALLQKRVLAIVQRDHLQSERLSLVVNFLAQSYDRASADFLKMVAEKSPHAKVRTDALLSFATQRQQVAMLAERAKEQPELAKRIEEFLGKEIAAEIAKVDKAKVEEESAAAFKVIAEKYLGEMGVDQAKNICMQMTFGGGKSAETFLRIVVDKEARDEVKGVATLSLGQVIKTNAERIPAAEAVKQQAEAEKLFEAAASKYADVKLGFGGTVGKKAKAELYDIRNLAVGRTAPEVEGVDQDGKAFKLSDYRGKVVLFDFWNEF